MGLKEKLREEKQEISSAECWKSVEESTGKINATQWKNICELICLASDNCLGSFHLL